MHAKDNAVSALGKVIRFQTSTIDPAVMIPNWLSLLPLKHDFEESKIQNELLVNLIQEQPLVIFGEQYQRFEQVVLILSEIL
jgi:hypothetical protein